MLQRKVNMLMVLFSLLGGVIGFFIGELLLSRLSEHVPSIVNIGLYFGILCFFISLMCLLAEIIPPRLNGSSWKLQYTGTSWKLLIPSTLLLLFAAGLVFEFVYELNIGKSKPPDQIIMAIDVSGSMQETDPDNERYAAAKQLVDTMESSKSVSVIAFNHMATVVQPLVKLSDQAARDGVKQKIDDLAQTDGGTDIAAALNEAMTQIKQSPDQDSGSTVILLSDGFSEVDLNSALRDYKSANIVVNTVGMHLVDPQGSGLLKDIAAQTGGKYYDVSDTKDLTNVFERIYSESNDRTLVTERSGIMKNSMFHAILRVFGLICLGGLIGLSLGIIFDNRFLARSFMIGGLTAGLLAGLILEFGFANQPEHGPVYRLLADAVLAVVLALFTAVVPIKDRSSLRAGSSGTRPASAVSSRGFNGTDNSSKGF